MKNLKKISYVKVQSGTRWGWRRELCRVISDLWRAAHVGSQPWPALLLNSCPMMTQVNSDNLSLNY